GWQQPPDAGGGRGGRDLCAHGRGDAAGGIRGALEGGCGRAGRTRTVVAAAGRAAVKIMDQQGPRLGWPWEGAWEVSRGLRRGRATTVLTTVLAGKSGHHRFFRKGGASRGASSGLRRLLAAGLILALLGSSAGPAYALPVFDGIAEDPDGNPYGDADVVQHGSTMTITQNTDRVIINWSSFSIDHDEIVEFIQGGPHRVALNRVTGNELSEIFGQLKSDGRLFLVNPAGIVFGEGAQVNVGALVASVLDIDNAAFWGGADAYT